MDELPLPSMATKMGIKHTNSRSYFQTKSLLTFSLILVLTSWQSHTLFSQLDADSLKNIWTNEAAADSSRFNALEDFYIQYSFEIPDSVIRLTNYHYDLALQKNDQEQIVKALDNRALAFCVQGKYDLGLIEMNKIVELVKDRDDILLLGSLYNNIGTIHYYENRYQEAVRYFSESLEIHRSKKVEFPQAEILNNIGLVYYEIDNLDLAADYFSQAQALYEKLDVSENMGNIWLNIAAISLDKKQYQEAIQNIEKAQVILEAENNQFSVADCYMMLAECYQNLGQIEDAKRYNNKSLKINESIGNEGKIARDLILQANLLIETEPLEALSLGNDVLITAKNSGDKTLLKDVYALLHQANKKAGNLELSLTALENYTVYDDSVQLESDKNLLIREAIQREFDEKFLQTQIENEKSQTELKVKQTKRTFIIIGVASILLLSILFYLRTSFIAHRNQKQALLSEIENLKKVGNAAVPIGAGGFKLNRERLEEFIQKKMNETDWNVLNILLEDPVISNKGIAEKAFLTVDGIGSSLRRMYQNFEIKESKYKKISLLMEAIKLSNS